jgi:hypothetical protein
LPFRLFLIETDVITESNVFLLAERVAYGALKQYLSKRNKPLTVLDVCYKTVYNECDFEPSILVIAEIASACNSSLEEMFYENIHNYKQDKEIISMLKKCNNETKHRIIIDLLKM